MLAWKNHYSNKKEKWTFYNVQTLAAVRCSVTRSSLTLLDPMACSTPGLLVPHYVPEFAQVYVHCIGDAIQPSHPLSPSSSAFSLCQHQVFFQCVGSLYHVAKVLKLQYLGLISFGIDRFDLLALQGTLKRLLQHHSWKMSMIRCFAFFMKKILAMCN